MRIEHCNSEQWRLYRLYCMVNKLTLHTSALYTGALDMQGASVTSMHFRALVCMLRTMVHAHACECKVKVELYRKQLEEAAKWKTIPARYLASTIGKVIGASLSEPHTSERFRRVNHARQKTD